MIGRKNIIVVAVVALIALAGCSSSDNSPSPTAIDTAPPAVPVDLSGRVSDMSVELTWTANTTDADLAGYKVYRENGSRVATLVDAPMNQTWYTDADPMSTVTNVYRVTSVDINGNESAYTSVQIDVDVDDPVSGDLHPFFQ